MTEQNAADLTASDESAPAAKKAAAPAAKKAPKTVDVVVIMGTVQVGPHKGAASYTVGDAFKIEPEEAARLIKLGHLRLADKTSADPVD
jgi:hypothetical protein